MLNFLSCKAMMMDYEQIEKQETTQLSWRILIVICMVIVIGAGYIASQKTNSLTEQMFSKFVPFNMRYNFYNDFLKNYNTGKDIRLYNMEHVVANEQNNIDIITYKIERKTKKRL